MSRAALDKISADASAEANKIAEPEEQTLMQQASEMAEYAKEAITEALVGPPPPPLTPRLQPFKSPRYKSAHGKAFLPSESEQTRVAVLHTGLTQQLHDAYGKTAIVVPEIGHLDHKRPFLELDGPMSARNAAPSLPGDSPTSGSQSARGPLVFSKHSRHCDSIAEHACWQQRYAWL